MRSTSSKRNVSMAKSFGLEAEIVDRAEIARRCPYVRLDDVLAGMWIPTDGRVNATDTTIAYAKDRGLDAIVRGLRNANDLELEQAMAQVNRANGVDTLLLTCDSAHLHLSSKLVRLVAQAGLPLDALVTPRVAAALVPAKAV